MNLELDCQKQRQLLEDILTVQNEVFEQHKQYPDEFEAAARDIEKSLVYFCLAIHFSECKKTKYFWHEVLCAIEAAKPSFPEKRIDHIRKRWFSIAKIIFPSSKNLDAIKNS